MKGSDSSQPVVRRLVACVALGIVLVSCSDDDDSSSDVCADREALRESVDALANIDVVSEGTNGVTAAVSDVEDDLAALRSSAGDELEPQVQAVQDAVDELETAAANLDSGDASTALAAVSELTGAAATLLGSLEAGACGASTEPTT